MGNPSKYKPLDKNIQIRKYNPSSRTICIKGAKYFLAFPYLTFIQDGNNGLYLFALKTEKHNIYYRTILPNHFSQCNVCSITSECIKDSVDWFWNSRFTLQHAVLINKNKSARDCLEDWQEDTKRYKSFDKIPNYFGKYCCESFDSHYIKFLFRKGKGLV